MGLMDRLDALDKCVIPRSWDVPATPEDEDRIRWGVPMFFVAFGIVAAAISGDLSWGAIAYFGGVVVMLLAFRFMRRRKRMRTASQVVLGKQGRQ